MLTHQTAKTRVEAGATLLDKVYPDWYYQIKVNDLDMSCACHCVLGQLDGDYNDARVKLWPVSWLRKFFSDTSVTQAIRCGFDVPDSLLQAEEDADYNLLQQEWVAAIAVRLTAPVSSSVVCV